MAVCENSKLEYPRYLGTFYYNTENRMFPALGNQRLFATERPSVGLSYLKCKLLKCTNSTYKEADT